MYQTALKPASHYKYLPELEQDEVLSLQRQTAAKVELDVVFHDLMTSGEAAPQMVVIPAGHFEMGSNQQEFGHRQDEYPQHYVTLQKAFAMGQFTITAEQFERFREETEWYLRPELIWSKGQYPVINIRAQDARLYAGWLSEQTGQTYRLPTEAEWEYAARAGSVTPFCFGESVSCKDVNFNPVFPYQEAKEKRKWYLPRCMPSIGASEVGIKQPNLWGLHDMHGNVWEFTSSPWTSSHLGANRDGSPSATASTEWIVTKGGSWFDAAVHARSAARKKRFFDELDTNLGFRLVRELDSISSA